jgi:type IV pilus assembly protein PilA
MLVKMRENKGFTLVELMIVVAIIGILAAVAIPFYQRYMAKSRVAQLVIPGVSSIMKSVTTAYSLKPGTFQEAMEAAVVGDDLSPFLGDGDSSCYQISEWTTGADEVSFKVTLDSDGDAAKDTNSPTRCAPLAQLMQKGSTTERFFTVHAMPTGDRGVIWTYADDLAVELGF